MTCSCKLNLTAAKRSRKWSGVVGYRQRWVVRIGTSGRVDRRK